jgi:hypothetical protein
MNTLTIGAARRPRLSLNYEPKAHPAARDHCRRRSSVLSTEELRRLVALMVD